ncbi:SusC/RagA family TonB-linked outer membrane protein [Sphingobacterium sp. C459-1T]|uniref:SusC/RagA family TonB-linked outer membrane protein n=2 Tax=Sphingobacterium faecale TaxID=2803775 RepID=A0ABS1R457_9SPHI|nr:SusC/RagA family TonB-linked outer membrane protein [Sphingobacterium faecale]
MKSKIKVCLLLVFLFGVNLAFSQNVTLQLKEVSLKEALQEVRKQTGFNFFYKEDDIREYERLKITVRDATLDEALRLLIKDLPLEYTVKNKIITIKRSSKKQQGERTRNVDPVIKQDEPVIGVVVDAKGKPLPGATVRVIGTHSTTITGSDGKFSFKNVPENSMLRIAYVGSKPLEIQAKPNLGRIILEVHESVIEEVILTGITERKAESFTGSATTIKGEDLRRVGNINVFQSLKNLDPTINIMESLSMGSNPNALPDMNIRGGTSFDDALQSNDNLKGNYQNQPNQPLFILDGFETSVERIYDLDMNTLESITILKDASAKALYGSKAANGVVVIESKRLNANKPRLTYTGSLDIAMPDLSSYKLVSAMEKLDLEFKEGLYPTNDPVALGKYNELRRKTLAGLDTYWLSQPVRMGYGQKHAMNVDLGKDELRTSLNLAYNDNVGVMKGSDRKNLNADLNLSYRLQKFRFQNRLSITNNNAYDSPYGSFSTYTLLNSYLTPYDEFGNLLPILEDGRPNPLYDGAIPTEFKAKYFQVTNNFETEYQVFEGFKARARVSVSHKNNTASRYYPTTHSKFAGYAVNDAERRGQFEVNNGNNLVYSGDFYLNYNKVLNQRHNFFVTLGANISENTFKEMVNYAEGFPSAQMNDFMFAFQYNTDRKRPGGNSGINREVGALSMISYTYMDKYLFDGTFRTNASSVFGNENPVAAFWSLGAGWNIHKEDFAGDWNGLKLLKLRGSLGSTGNQNFRNNKSLSVNKYYMEDRYGNLIGSYAINMENPDLKWEQKMDYNLGLDADYKGISVKFDIYRAITQNMVTSVSTAPSVGFTEVSENLGKVENKGMELGVAYTVFQNKNGFIRLSGAAVSNTNTILEISEVMREFNNKQLRTMDLREGHHPLESTAKPTILYYDGLAMNTIWAVPSYGIDPATGLEVLKGKDGQPTYLWKGSDMVPSGISVPKYRGNFGINGEYKGIGLSVICTYLGGGQLYNTTLLDKIENVDIHSNFDIRVLSDRWMYPGQMTPYKRNTGATPYDMRNGTYRYNSDPWRQELTRPTQRFVQDQNELNISSISLSYDFNRRWLTPYKLERLRLFVYMNDVVKFSSIGIERGTTYPFARTVSFKLSATF